MPTPARCERVPLLSHRRARPVHHTQQAGRPLLLQQQGSLAELIVSFGDLADYNRRVTRQPSWRAYFPRSAGWTVHSVLCHLPPLSSLALDCPSAANQRQDGRVAPAHSPHRDAAQDERVSASHPPRGARTRVPPMGWAGWGAPRAHAPPSASLAGRARGLADDGSISGTRGGGVGGVRAGLSDSEGGRAVGRDVASHRGRLSTRRVCPRRRARALLVGGGARPRVRSISRTGGRSAAGCPPPHDPPTATGRRACGGRRRAPPPLPDVHGRHH